MHVWLLHSLRQGGQGDVLQNSWQGAQGMPFSHCSYPSFMPFPQTGSWEMEELEELHCAMVLTHGEKLLEKFRSLLRPMTMALFWMVPLQRKFDGTENVSVTPRTVPLVTLKPGQRMLVPCWTHTASEFCGAYTSPSGMWARMEALLSLSGPALVIMTV